MNQTSTSKNIRINRHHGIIRSVKLFFGLPVRNSYRKSRIVRRPSRYFEEFIFKGYDQQRPDLSRSGSFKDLRLLWKN